MATLVTWSDNNVETTAFSNENVQRYEEKR